MAAASPPVFPAARWLSLEHPRIEERTDISARRVRIPRASIDHVPLDRQHWNACLLECALDEEAARARRFHTSRPENQRTVDAMFARLVHKPLGGPRRDVQVLVEARCPAGQRGHRIVESVANISVGPK